MSFTAQALYGLLFQLPVYMHLWFLAFLCWLVAGFVGYAFIAKNVKFKRFPKWLPLVILAQWFVKDMPIPATVKFIGITVVISAFLLLTYEYLIRYSIIGSMLNGPRKRERSASPARQRCY